MRLKHTRFTALDMVAIDQHHRYKIDAIAMRALGRGPTDTISGVNAKLMRFDEPLFCSLPLGGRAGEGVSARRSRVA